MPKTKKKVGIFSLACDEGCSIYLIEIFNNKLLGWLEKMELVYFLSIKDKTEIKDIDIALVEGVVTTEEDMKEIKKIKKGDIIVSPMTTPEYTPILNKVAAIVTDEGGITSHAAVISREMKIPCIIGTKIATKVFKDGYLVEVDANKGIIKKLR